MTAGLDELLTREGAVVELVHRTMRDEAVDMSDYYALRHNMAVLGGFHSSTVVRAWFAAQRAHLIERSIAFCKQFDVAQLPAPTRIRQLRDFARYPLDQLDSTQSLIGRFERAQGDALMQLVKRRDALLRGDVKNQLTSWWLGVIRERVSAFLAQVGYSRRARRTTSSTWRTRPPTWAPSKRTSGCSTSVSISTPTSTASRRC
jgi:hypothetical protein